MYVLTHKDAHGAFWGSWCEVAPHVLVLGLCPLGTLQAPGCGRYTAQKTHLIFPKPGRLEPTHS